MHRTKEHWKDIAQKHQGDLALAEFLLQDLWHYQNGRNTKHGYVESGSRKEDLKSVANLISFLREQ